MAKKVLSVRIDEKTIDTMNYFCGTQEISQADFVTEAVEKHCADIAHLRMGGGVAKLPNPQIYLYSAEQAAEVYEVLTEAVHKLNRICPSLDFGMNEIVAFANQRIYKDSKEQKEKFSANLYNDLENTKKGE